jgi:hypothetical protein
MLLCLWVPVLFRHTKVYHIYSVCRLMSGTADEEIIGFDIAVDQVFFMYSLHACYLRAQREKLDMLVENYKGLPHLGAVKENNKLALTICFANMAAVLMLNFRPHISNRSSRLGPSMLITRILYNPSWPK